MFQTFRNHPVFSEYSGYSMRDYRSAVNLIDQMVDVAKTIKGYEDVLSEFQINSFVYEAWVTTENFRTACQFLEQAIDFLHWFAKNQTRQFAKEPVPTLNELCTLFGFNADVAREYRPEPVKAVKPEWIYGEKAKQVSQVFDETEIALALEMNNLRLNQLEAKMGQVVPVNQ
jgi:hypothetical protein